MFEANSNVLLTEHWRRKWWMVCKTLVSSFSHFRLWSRAWDTSLTNVALNITVIEWAIAYYHCREALSLAKRHFNESSLLSTLSNWTRRLFVTGSIMKDNFLEGLGRHYHPHRSIGEDSVEAFPIYQYPTEKDQPRCTWASHQSI